MMIRAALASETHAPPLLKTKLYPPVLRPGLVPRRFLLEELHHTRYRRLSVLSAPAGFGKTTLAASWSLRFEGVACWLSLDPHDMTPRQLLRYLLASFQEHIPNFARNVSSRLQAPDYPLEQVVIHFVNELSSLHEPFLLVLDDLHLLPVGPVTTMLCELIEKWPKHGHICVTTRSSEMLPMNRWRAKGFVGEWTGAQLRFSKEESELLFEGGCSLQPAQMQALYEQSEGWVAGLLLSISYLQNHQVSGLSQFSRIAENEYTLGFLCEEILLKLPDDVQHFLLKTSIVRQFDVSLCVALTGRTDCEVLLSFVEHQNLFIERVGTAHQWFRYHSLFRKMLNTQLKDKHPTWVPSLHQNAYTWYREHAMYKEALEHASANDDEGACVSLLDEVMEPLHRQHDLHELQGLFSVLSEDCIVSHERTLFYSLWLHIDLGSWDHACERMLAESSLHHSSKNAALWHFLQGVLALHHEKHGDAIESFERVIDCQGHPYIELWAVYYLGMSYSVADVPLHRTCQLMTNILSQYASNHVHDYLYVSAVLASVWAEYKRGHLQLAIHRCEEHLRLFEASVHYEELRVLYAPVYAFVGYFYLERGQEERARANIDRAYAAIDKVGWFYRKVISLFWLQVHMEDEESEALVHQVLEDVSVGDLVFSQPGRMPLEGYIALFHLFLGGQTYVRAWSEKRSFSVDMEIVYADIADVFVYVQWLLVSGGREELGPLLQKIKTHAHRNHDVRAVIESCIFLSAYHTQRGEQTEALAALREGILLAVPGGYLGIFMWFASLIEQALCSLLQEPFEGDEESVRFVQTLRERLGGLQVAEGGELSEDDDEFVVDVDVDVKLSKREVEVLGLVAQGMTNRDIATDLYISVETVKKHMKNIFQKLEVRNRVHAVTRARLLKLLPLS